MSRSDIIARAIETQAWAALGVGDTLAYKNRRVSSERKAANILAALTDAGYRITAPDRLDAKTIEACAKVADAAQAMRERLYSENQAGINAHKATQAEMIAAAIRKLAEEGT